MAYRESAYGKRKPTVTYVGCRECHQVYRLNEEAKCPHCGKPYIKFKGFPGDREKRY